ncbi:MAG: putrescine aminotransferase [Bacillota bacterium]|jgi:putrescine aminotransferase|nr:putrescine aminotransferase [Bacillota bacterium]MDK2960698.1 putrescine aminotransferase [Bacillota bacterium]
MGAEKLYTIETAIAQNREEVIKNHREYVNAGLAGMLGLIGFDKRFVRAAGMRVWDDEGNEYLDFLGSYGALNLGHNPPAVLAAIERVKELPNMLQASLSPLAGAVAHNLAAITPGGLKRAFFANSGAEAVEGALKLARIATGKEKIISCEGSFHGKTMGALSVTGRKKYQEPFRPLVPGCEAIPYGDLDLLEAKLKGGDVAAFIVEPIQGEGGIIVPPDGYLKGVRELTQKYGALFIADEVQTGFGRTGYLFGCDYEEVAPDVICLAKSLGGGVMPVGAYVAAEEVWQRAYGSMDKALLHTSTFGGNTWAMAAALASIEAVVEGKLAEKARELGEYFIGRLRELQKKYPLLKEVRGRGLFIGLEFSQPEGLLNTLTGGALKNLAQEYQGALVASELLNKHHIITAYTLNNPNVIRLEPPLIVTKEEIDYVVNALEEVLSRQKSFLSIAFTAGKNMLGRLTRS